MAFKNNLDLLRLLEGPCRYYFNRGKFQSHLFAQLTSDSVRWLLSCFNETSRQTPSGSRSKTMFQYQHSPLIIDDNSRSSDGKRLLGKPNVTRRSRRGELFQIPVIRFLSIL